MFRCSGRVLCTSSVSLQGLRTVLVSSLLDDCVGMWSFHTSSLGTLDLKVQRVWFSQHKPAAFSQSLPSVTEAAGRGGLRCGPGALGHSTMMWKQQQHAWMHVTHIWPLCQKRGVHCSWLWSANMEAWLFFFFSGHSKYSRKKSNEPKKCSFPQECNRRTHFKRLRRRL